MPKKQHSEEQIISALKQSEGGEKAADICKLGVQPSDLLHAEAPKSLVAVVTEKRGD